MASERQIDANRQNAQRSTGPKTAEGKARVSSNPLKHGLTGKLVVLPHEDPDEFDEFRNSLLSDLKPHGELEGVLAEKIVADAWRLRRVPLLEAALHRRGYQNLIVEQLEQTVRNYECGSLGDLLVESQVALSDRKAHDEAAAKLQEARSKLNVPALAAPRTLERSLGAFANLWRHEIALSRSMLGVLHELQRLQAARAGEQVALPQALDVNVNLRDEAPPLDH